MDTRFYQAQGLDIQRIAIDLENMFLTQGYQVQHFGDRGHMVVQFKKGGEFAAIVGMQAALTLTLQNTPGGVMAVIGQQKWADKAAAGAVGLLILWPLAFTAGAGAIRQSNLTEQLLNALDAVVRQQQANVQVGPVPFHMLPPQVQQQMVPPIPQSYTPPPPPPPQWIPGPQPSYPPQQPVMPPPPPIQQARAGAKSPAPATIECPHCHAQNDAGDIYCARCGQPLVPQKVRCPKCGASNKPDAAFCTKCGASFAPENRAEEPTAAVEMTPKTQVVMPNQPVATSWGYLVFANEQRVELNGSRLTVGRANPDTGDVKPDINLYDVPESSTVSRMHAVIERTMDGYTLTDLKSTNLTRINGQILAPNTPTPFEDGSTLEFGKVSCTFTAAS
ncbi:MAG TPA: zinc-ribbon domain-containing protein [Ktedonobacteraceae bacterium]|nr:zinc-ribbon domain-containing protein [Ktedonobacteraceae bacterium]